MPNVAEQNYKLRMLISNLKTRQMTFQFRAPTVLSLHPLRPAQGTLYLERLRHNLLNLCIEFQYVEENGCWQRQTALYAGHVQCLHSAPSGCRLQTCNLAAVSNQQLRTTATALTAPKQLTFLTAILNTVPILICYPEHQPPLPV